MNSENAPADLIGRCFGMQSGPHVSVVPLDRARVGVTRLNVSGGADESRLVKIPACGAYLLTIYLRDARHCDVDGAGRESEVRRFRRGSVCLIDLGKSASIRLFGSLDAMGLYIPRDLFSEIEHFYRMPAPVGLRCLRGIADRTLCHIGEVLGSELESGKPPNVEMVGHLAIALCGHLQQHYQLQYATGDQRNGFLSPFEEKAILEYLMDHFDKPQTEDAIAGLVGLEPDQFSRKFRGTTGRSLDTWLGDYRLERAKAYMHRYDLPVSEILRTCGLPDDERILKRLKPEMLDFDLRKLI